MHLQLVRNLAVIIIIRLYIMKKSMILNRYMDQFFAIFHEVHNSCKFWSFEWQKYLL